MYQLFEKKNIACLSITLAVACVLLCAGQAQAQKRLDFGNATTLWEDGTNWNPDGVPGSLDIAEINRSANGDTLNISSTQAVSELQVGFRNGSGTYTQGVTTLNVLAGTSLSIGNSSGARIGRAMVSGDAVGSSEGRVIQTGGAVVITTGTNGMRLSGETSGTLANSLYRISGGSMRGGTTNGSMTAPLQIGNIGGGTYGLAELHVLGSGASEIRYEDVRIQSASGGGTSRIHFTLDNLGVTPITAEDEMRFSGLGNNQLVVDLAGLPPLTDITLIIADRLNLASSSPAETFTGLPDLSPMSASFGGFTYNWLLDYTDASDNGVLDASVVLRFQSVAAVPEVSAFALVGLVSAGSISIQRFRRRKTA